MSAASSDTNRPVQFSMPIQGGLLDNLGINMYSDLGKCLVEFAANAYDSDSPFVNITLDEQSILSARKSIRDQAIKKAKDNNKKRPTFIEDPLPDHLSVVISDSGHGMSPDDIQNKFLPINRNRRKDANGDETRAVTEAGKRFVMGRKGIGKLSGFGAATKIIVTTKRSGQTFQTKFTLSLQTLRNEKNLAETKIPVEYIDNLPIDDHGTVIEMHGLKCDSMKFTIDAISNSLSDAFFPIQSSEFKICINGSEITRPSPDYQFVWPGDDELDSFGYAHDKATDPDGAEIDFQYIVKFRDKSLPAARRGARVYCNGRLAFGPNLMNLNTGTHNFMAHQYMECIVQADDLDRQNVDLISTDRGDIRRNNDLVEAFFGRVTEIMQKSIAAHSQFKDREAESILDKSDDAKEIRSILDEMPSSQRASGRKIVNIIISRHGVESQEFKTIAPLIVQSMNAGEVLVELIRVSNNPTDVKELARHIIQLREIEKSDTLKLLRARRNGIRGLRTLTNRGEDTWSKGPRNEKDLHKLLKDAPWLIRPELAGFLASDQVLDKVVSNLAKALGVDKFSGSEKDPGYDNKRPDLVFLLSDSRSANRILIVELKSTTIPLEREHLNQLQRYIRKVESWLETQFPSRRVMPSVEGMLIGAMPKSDTGADGQLDLLDIIRKKSMHENWEVVGLHELLERTEMVNRELIEALESEEKDDH